MSEQVCGNCRRWMPPEEVKRHGWRDDPERGMCRSQQSFDFKQLWSKAADACDCQREHHFEAKDKHDAKVW